MTPPSEAKAFQRDEQVGFSGVPGLVVLLDAEMHEVVERQECHYDWEAITGGATFHVTTHHVFDISGKSVTYVAILRPDGQVQFVWFVVRYPIEHSETLTVG